MRKFALLVAGLGVGLLPVMFAAPAHAQATRTWVSGVGDDANPCSRTAPCKTFAGAISKTAAFGEINCVDPGGFGAVTITKSIALVCDYTEAGVLVSGTNAIIVNLPLGTDVVTLKGLDFEGLGTSLNGVNFIQAGTLHVHKVQIRGFRGSNGNGIRFAPTVAGAKLFVADSYITDNGNGAGTAGILMTPSGAGSVTAIVNRVSLENNTQGIQGVGAVGAGAIRASFENSVAAGSSSFNGVTVFTPAGGSGVTIMMRNSSASGNSIGVRADGSSTFILLGESVITANSTGMSAVNSGSILTYNNNQVLGNIITDGATTGPATPK